MPQSCVIAAAAAAAGEAKALEEELEQPGFLTSYYPPLLNLEDAASALSQTGHSSLGHRRH